MFWHDARYVSGGINPFFNCSWISSFLFRVCSVTVRTRSLKIAKSISLSESIASSISCLLVHNLYFFIYTKYMFKSLEGLTP